MTISEVASYLGCGRSPISRRLQRLGLRRTKSEAAKVAYERGRKPMCLPGEASPNWKGGKIGGEYPSVKAPNHTKVDKKGYVPEHLLVWEETHGKPLPKGWVIHHLNGVKNDNRPSNLAAMLRSKHNRLIPTLKGRIRGLEVENRQLRRALEDSQAIFYVSEN